jgi:hypothetical protein
MNPQEKAWMQNQNQKLQGTNFKVIEKRWFYFLIFFLVMLFAFACMAFLAERVSSSQESCGIFPVRITISHELSQDTLSSLSVLINQTIKSVKGGD